jgi:hypothetical protein
MPSPSVRRRSRPLLRALAAASLALPLAVAADGGAADGGAADSGAASHGHAGPSRVPSAGEGEITPSGKFVPRRAPAEDRTGDVAPLIAETGPGRFLVAGRVAVDRAARTVTVPAAVNQRQHQVEYLLVSEYGKRHESVLRTAARPEHVHAACLMLGLAQTPFPPDEARAQAVDVDIVWPKHGPPGHFTPEQTFLAVATGNAAPTDDAAPAGHAAATHPPAARWIYNGSDTGPSGFAAQVEGSLIALIPDGAALINGLDLPTGDYFADDDALPPLGTPVQVVLRFPAHDAAH